MARVLLLRSLLSETTFFDSLSKLAKKVKINFQYQVFAATEIENHRSVKTVNTANSTVSKVSSQSGYVHQV